MSIEIKKNLYIKTLDYLYKLIKSNDELIDNNTNNNRKRFFIYSG